MDNKIKVLIIVDAQNAFINGNLGSEQAIAAVPHIVDAIKNGGYDVVLATMDTHGKDYLETQEGKRLPVIHGQKGTPGYLMNEDIKAAYMEHKNSVKTGALDQFFEKGTFGSLTLGEKLYQINRYLDEELEIHFVGFCTGICVISNAVIAKTYCPEARICILEKACACVTPESHKHAIETMKQLQMDII